MPTHIPYLINVTVLVRCQVRLDGEEDSLSSRFKNYCLAVLEEEVLCIHFECDTSILISLVFICQNSLNDGYSLLGDDCTADIDECQSEPCLNSGESMRFH